MRSNVTKDYLTARKLLTTSTSHFKTQDSMGHACTKGVDEDLEQMRQERERRLGLVRVSGSNSSVNTSGMRQPPQFHIQQQQQQHQQMQPTPVRSIRQVNVGGRPPTPSRAGSSRPRFLQEPRVQAERSASPSLSNRAQEQVTRLSWQPDSARRTSVRPANDRTVQPNTIQPTQSPERAHLPLARPLARGTESTLRPMVAQALNQLCAIELQHRMQILNEEFVDTFQLSSRLEGLLGLEKLRVAGFELHTLEKRSRDSISSQEMMERRNLWSWMGGVVEESRLSDIIRRTLESTIIGTPRSASNSRRTASPPRITGNAASKPSTSALGTNFDVPKHSSLKWTAVPRDSGNELRGYVAAPQQKGRNVSPVRTVSPVDVFRGPGAHVELFDEQKRTAAKHATTVQEEFRRPSPDTLSAEEQALDEKIARQRALISSSQSVFGAHPHRAPPAAPSAAPLPPAAFQDAAQTGGETQFVAAREESRAATRKRLSALTGLR